MTDTCLEDKIALRNQLRLFYNSVPDSTIEPLLAIGEKIDWDKIHAKIVQLTSEIDEAVK